MILITGASKGIGRYLFLRFRETGNFVVGTYNSTVSGFEQDGDSYYQLNVANHEEVKQVVDIIKPKLQDIVLINCAGINYNSFGHKADIEKWNQVIDVNIKGTFHVIREILPIMREQNYGRIISFSSVVIQKPTLGISAYAASKSAIIGMTKSLAVENAAKGITVNAINLGYANIGMGINDVSESLQEEIKNQIPAKRFCEPEEVFQTVQYLIQTEYVNGTAIDINGGLV